MDQPEIPLYRSRKLVHAVRITACVVNPATGEAQVYFSEPGCEPRAMSKVWMDRLDGHYAPDGYLVIYEDGYTSWSPADVFEAGYLRESDNPLSYEQVEAYIRSLKFSPGLSEEAITIAVGNIRGFAAHVRRVLQPDI